MENAKKILIADDDQSIRTVLSQALKREGYDVSATDNGATLYQWISAGQGDLVITDVLMPGENGLDLIPKIHRRRPEMKVIVMSAQNALTTAVSASEKGAMDFLPKPFDIDQLIEMVKNALQQNNMPAQVPDTIGTVHALNKSFVVGQSRVMQGIYRTIARLTNTDLTVLISGESGTGKEIIARALHEFSHRKDGPFVAINMAAIPKELIESELFGHEKGAFTGAVQKVIGRFEQAAGGTLFLDEIGDMPFEAQTRLLRVLQEGEFTTVGGRKPIKTNVRIVAATNQDIHALVAQKKFREDLFYRLNVVSIAVPPLRQRKEDIPALVQHFLQTSDKTKVFTPEAMAALQEFNWPGNIRMLESFVHRMVVMSAQDAINEPSVRSELRMIDSAASNAVQMQESLFNLMHQTINKHFDTYFVPAPPAALHSYVTVAVERPMIEWVLRHTGGNQIKAAEILGINRNTLRTKIRDMGIEFRK